ncbi:RILP-like protein 1 [Entelurus aequoreus]|uniref:RILP-like protein 1 n=1 Tax=Entelurus aequoreus TaxID=161455 RepID=UPI002B1D34F1|nr:RILP-like protein 1 [Entelurus aequoreus]
MSALDRPVTELTVLDVYDIAAALAQEFERTIDRFGCEALVGVVPKVVHVLELLEKLVSRGAAGQEADDELRKELLRLRQERSDRHAQERKHHQELEQVEDVWRAEVQDLLSQITPLQAENKKLLASLSLTEAPVAEKDLQKQDGMSDKERQVKKLTNLVDKQRDELRANDHELTLKNDDIEALQMQQHRLIRINQDLRHRLGMMEAQSKAVMRQRAELQAAAQARQQQMAALQLEARCLRAELQECELEREVVKMEANCRSSTSGSTLSSSPQLRKVAPSDSVKPNSVWVECGGDPGCSDLHITSSASREINVSTSDREGDVPTLLLEEAKEETDFLEQESDAPRFTLQELRDVLQERNELKSQVFLMQEELAYYKSEEFEEDMLVCASSSPSPPCSASSDLPESGIRRLIFTAIMPMVAAGLIADDPTLLPIRRLVSLV